MPPIMPLSRLYAGFLDLLYPRRCPVCAEIAIPKGSLICPGCMEKLAFVRRPVCKCCEIGRASCRERVSSPV